MTDLLTPSDNDLGERGPVSHASQASQAEQDDQLAEDQRTFRAATLDEAVAAARVELGDEVELIEAHRVRRGGLGGFFATDLGVEIIAAPRRPTAAAAPSRSTTTGNSHGAGDGSGGSAIDRLIERADAVDRMSPLARTPADTHESVPSGAPEPTRFDDVLRAELADAWTDSDQAVAVATKFDDPTLQLDAPASTPLVAPSELYGPAPAAATRSLPLADELRFEDEIADRFADAMDPDAVLVFDDELVTGAEEFAFDDEPSDAVEIDGGSGATDSPTVELARPPEIDTEIDTDTDTDTDTGIDTRIDIDNGIDSIEELDALLRRVGVDPAEPVVGRSTQIVRQREAAVMPMQHAAALATSQLVESVVALGAQTARTVTKVSISVTSSDGTTVSVSTDLAAGVNHG